MADKRVVLPADPLSSASARRRSALRCDGSLPPPVCAAAIVDVREREKKREQDGAALVTHDTRGEGREKVGLFIGLG